MGENDFQVNGAGKQGGVWTFVSDQGDFKQKLVRRDRERHFILINNLPRRYNNCKNICCKFWSTKIHRKT
jgi:hypothetical protein